MVKRGEAHVLTVSTFTQRTLGCSADYMQIEARFNNKEGRLVREGKDKLPQGARNAHVLREVTSESSASSSCASSAAAARWKALASAAP